MQEKFKVITTFTVIADMAKNMAGDTQRKSARLPNPALKSMSISQRPAILNGAGALILADGLNFRSVVPCTIAPFRRTGHVLHRCQTDGHYRRPV